MLSHIEIEGNFLQVDADDAIVNHPELTVQRLSNHVIEVFRADKSLGRFQNEKMKRVCLLYDDTQPVANL